jgi:hypothetical protein
MILLARGYNQTDLAKELGVTRMTVNRDVHYINEMTNKGLFDQAKSTIPTMYFNCLDGLGEIERKCWRIIDNEENNPAINQWHKLAAMRLAGDVIEKKFNIIQNGPEIMQLRKLQDRVEEIRRAAFENRDTFTQRLPSYSSSSSPYHDFNVRDLDKP